VPAPPGKPPRGGPGAINNSMKAQTFKGFVIESLDLADRLELIGMGLSDEGWAVVKCSIDWSSVGEKRFDGTPYPFMKCSYWPNWPGDREPEEIWSVQPTSEITRLYLNDEPGDVELATEMMLEIASDWDADFLWEALDGGWYDVATGKLLPQKLHKLI